MKLATYIILLGAISVSLLFASMAVIIYVDVPTQQDKLLQQGGMALAENIRKQIEPAVVTNNRIDLDEAVTKAKLSDRNIEYVVVLDATGNPMASTFPRGVPLHLIELLASKTADKKTVYFQVEDQPLVDISAPIMGGDLGSLHIGFDRQQIADFVNSRILRLTIVFAVLAVGALTAAIGIGKGVGKPLERIANEFHARSGRWPQLDHIEPGPTREVSEFLSILKQMIGELETAERRRQNYDAKLMGMERMASVGQLASEVAHEINNPLDGLIEMVHYLSDVADDSAKVRKYLTLMKKGLEQIESTGRRLLTFSRSSTEEHKEVFDVREVIRDITMLMKSSADRQGVTVEVTGQESCLAVGNGVATGQAIMNLLLNAMDAVSDRKGKVIIDAQSHNGEVLVTVADNGPGVDEEIKDRVFEPFFSTKEAGLGTGLGLAVSRTLLRKGGGDLVLADGRSKCGGAKFVIRLIKSEGIRNG
jgi:signal transduction histidine kinase